MTTLRNNTICILYQEGVTQADLAIRFAISKARVGQILKRAGITPDNRVTPANRTAFIGVNLSEGVKNALQYECLQEGIPVSKFVSNLVVKELHARGIEITEE